MDGFQILVLILAAIAVALGWQVRTLGGRVSRLEQASRSGWSAARPNVLSAPTDGSDQPASVQASTPGQPSAEVRALIDAGQKIGAIKRYRMETGTGLKEAKEAVEAFERGGL
jgi:ribosomal protein L7/L12